ncbi:hypothetical protein CHS0354_024666 [Potamilus streckersoni]|uniref:NACHT domain-containing protein n=1 Tax=Potamilus streckersoni TaxID=2493646 RepID=A0AAE0SWL7_9BIVA|nr:hypothetical protein CHS0354_024666 [Potamilus streckersoni]
MASVKPGDTLEQRLKDPCYKNWLKAGMCFYRVKDGLETFVESESKMLHQYILTRCTPCVQCTQDGLECKNNKKLCHKCFPFKCEIMNIHNKHKPNWGNTNIQKWLHDHWSVAKCFMNPGQSGNNTASETDISGLLNFIIHYNNFQDPKYGDIQKNAENVLKENFVILLENEYKVKLTVLEGRVDDLDNEFQQLKQSDVIHGQEIGKTAEEVRDLEKKYEQIKAKIDKIQEDHHEVQTLKAGLQVQETIIKNLSERVECKFSFITQQFNEIHTHIKEIKSKVAHLEAVTRDHGEKLEVLYARVPKDDEILDKVGGNARKRRLTDDQEGPASKRSPSYQQEIDHLKWDLKSCYKSLSTVPISAYDEEETIPLESFYVAMDITLEYQTKDRENTLEYETKDRENTQEHETKDRENKQEHETKDREKVKLSSYKQIFLDKNQRIILTGLSGSGKSTFCRKIVNTWCMEEPKKENETSEETDPSISDSSIAIGDQNDELSISNSFDASKDEIDSFAISSIFLIDWEPSSSVTRDSYYALKDEIDSPVVPSKCVIDWERPSSVTRDSSEAIEDQDVLRQFLLLFYIYAPKISTEKTLIEVLKNQCLKRESDQLSKILEEQPEKVLIILDGMDEMGDNIPSFLSDLLVRKLHPRIIVLMAMRPWKISQLRLKPLSHYDLLLEVQGLSEISALKFFQNVINVNKMYMTVERTIGSLTDEEKNVLSSVRKIPILVLFLSHIWCQDQCLTKRRYDLYTKILDCLIKRCLNKTGSKYTPALTDQDDINMKKEQFWELYINGVCQTAHDFLLKGVSGPSVVMQEKDLMKKLGTNAELKLGALLDSGIMSKQDAFSPFEKKVSVTFLHVSIHEFLASKHLVNNDAAFQNFLTSIKTLNDVLRYENIIIFICGHDTKKGHEAFIRIRQVCDEDPLVIQYRQEMNCNYDSHIITLIENVIEKIYIACLIEMDNEELIEISDIYFAFKHTIELTRLRSCYVKSLYLCETRLDLDSLYCMTNLTSLKLHHVDLLGGVLELSKLSNLTSLTMNEMNEPFSVHDLRNLTKLTFLNLFFITLSDGVLDLSSLTNLTYLRLCDVTISGGVHGLSSLTNLTYLTLKHVTMPDDALDLSRLTNLTSLVLFGVLISKKGSGCLCSSIHICTRLEKITLRNITLYDGVLDLRGLTKQTSFILHQVTMSEECSRSVCSSISGWTHLVHLELVSIMLHNGVIDLTSLTHLSSLTLESVTMSEECTRYLCSSISLCIHLENLKLKSIMLHDGVLDVSSLSNLSFLTLHSVTMSAKCTQCLCSSISSCTHLQHLEWKGIKLYKGVLNLSSLTNLNHLTLHDVTMYDESTRYLCSIISCCTHLERLDLEGMEMQAGILDLSNLTNLRDLKLDDVTMSKECSRSLCNTISGFTQLEGLTLFNIRLHDGVLDLTGLSSLVCLWIFDVTMSLHCKQTLQESLKKCCKLESFKVECCTVDTTRGREVLYLNVINRL